MNNIQSIIISDENTPNYVGYIVRAGINGAIAGWMAAESGGINRETNADWIAKAIGLDIVPYSGFALDKIAGGLTGIISTSLVDKTIGLENIDISISQSALITDVESNINVGGNKAILLSE